MLNFKTYIGEKAYNIHSFVENLNLGLFQIEKELFEFNFLIKRFLIKRVSHLLESKDVCFYYCSYFNVFHLKLCSTPLNNSFARNFSCKVYFLRKSTMFVFSFNLKSWARLVLALLYFLGKSSLDVLIKIE